MACNGSALPLPLCTKIQISIRCLKAKGGSKMLVVLCSRLIFALVLQIPQGAPGSRQEGQGYRVWRVVWVWQPTWASADLHWAESDIWRIARTQPQTGWTGWATRANTQFAVICSSWWCPTCRYVIPCQFSLTLYTHLHLFYCDQFQKIVHGFSEYWNWHFPPETYN